MLGMASCAWLLAVATANAFYNPQTGRWLSRDPIGEKGGRNVCIFGRNDPIGSHDVLGLILSLTCRKCGPDVTIAVDATLDEVAAKFADPNVAEGTKQAACKGLYAVPGGMDAWDLSEIYAIGAGGTAMPKNWPKNSLGTGGCERAVVYKGQCVYASALNYILLGKMNQLCNAAFGGSSWEDVYWLIFKYKHLGRGEWSDEVEQAFCFASIGYGGGCRCGGKTLNKLKDCDTQSSPQVPGPLRWKWRGINPPQNRESTGGMR
jgi:hypothetical protein